jgi:hypothetical protein
MCARIVLLTISSISVDVTLFPRASDNEAAAEIPADAMF